MKHRVEYGFLVRVFWPTIRPVSPVDSRRLTRRQKEIAALIRDGLANREIAERLFISERTVEWHVEEIFNKLAVNSRAQVAAWAADPDRDVTAARAGNLPVESSSFVGRARDLAQVEALARRSQLVTLTGAGGIGKTRVALRAARRIGGRFPDGTWLVDLAAVADGGQVTEAVAAALGLATLDTRTYDSLVDELSPRSALLVLDNCEHVLSACAAIATRILERCPSITLIATSRQPLGLAAEAVWQLQPLDTDESLQLFSARAAAAAPDFKREADHDSVVAICERLGGMPLAIELVVPHLRAVTAADLVTALAHSGHRLLTSPQAGGRHESVEATIAWSYDLLNPSEQALFRRLGVASGWISFEDALALAGDGWSSTEVFTVLLSLVTKSLVVADTQEGTASRYRLLELLRDFARDRLRLGGELDAAQRTHTAHFSALADRAREELSRPVRGRRWIPGRRQVAIGVAALMAVTLAAGFGYRFFEQAPAIPFGGLATIHTVAHTNAQYLVYGMAIDGSGQVYFPDADSVKRLGPAGDVTTVAGTGTAGYTGDSVIATKSGLTQPTAVAVGADGRLYIADRNDNRIRVVAGGIITTFAGTGHAGDSGDGGPALQADISGPAGLTIDTAGSLYFSESTHRIRKVDRGGVITTYAGSGRQGFGGDGQAAVQAALDTPLGLAVDIAGNLYIADSGNNRVRRVTTSGIIETVAGTGMEGHAGDGGPALRADVPQPLAVAVDSRSAPYIYISESDARVRRLDPSGMITTLVGTGQPGFSADGGPATQARVNAPSGLAVDAAGNLYIYDTFNRRIIKLSHPSG